MKIGVDIYEYDNIASLTTVDTNAWIYGTGAAGPHALTAAGSDTFSYDDAGRQTVRTVGSTTSTMTWTPTGMVETHTTGTDETVFVYDADDSRVLRIDPDGTVNTTIGGVWETNGTNNTSYYTFGNDLIAVRIDDGSVGELTYLITDLLDTVSVGYNHSTGGTVTRNWYDPWGIPRGTGDTIPTELSYTGQRSDPTGLMDYNARLYDPTHATFISPDTIIPDPTNPADWNRYAYVRNNPTNLTDPTGHETCGYRAMGTGQELVCWSDYEQYTEQIETGKAFEGNSSVDVIRQVEEPRYTTLGEIFAGEIEGLVDETAPVVEWVAGRPEQIAACVWDAWTCTDNIIFAMSPYLAASWTVATASGLALACTTGLGCAVAAPTLGIIVVGGLFATAHFVNEAWLSPGDNYRDLSAPWRDE